MTSPRDHNLEPTHTVEGSVGRVAIGYARRPPGEMHVLAPRGFGRAKPSVRVKVTNGVLKDLLEQGVEGLSRSRGGRRQGESVEIKGFLLGRVERSDDGYVVKILRHCPVALSDADTVASAVFAAKDRAVLESALAKARRRDPEIQVLGSYHSHPGHGTRLSEDDVDHLQQWFPEAFQIGAIIEPERREVGVFIKVGQRGFAGRLDPAYLVRFDRAGEPNAPVEATNGGPPPGIPLWLKYSIAVGLIVVVLVVSLWPHRDEDHDPVRFVEKPVGVKNLTDENARFEVKIEALEDAVIRVSFDGSEPSSWVSLQPAMNAAGEVGLSAGDTLHITASAMHAGLEGNKSYNSDLVIEYAMEDGSWYKMAYIGLSARIIDINPVVREEHDWLNWGDIDVDSNGTVTVTLRRPEDSGGSLSGSIDVRNSNEQETFDFRIETGETESRVKLDRGKLREAKRWPRMELSALCLSEGEAGPQGRWVSPADAVIRYQRVDTQIGVRASNYRQNECTITITSPERAVGGVFYEVWRSSNPVDDGNVGMGETDSFDYEIFPLEPHQLSVKSYFYGEGEVYRAKGRVRVESPDWGFMENQGPEGLLVLKEHYDIYEDRGLSQLGEMRAIPHADDIADSQDWQRYYFIILTRNNAVQESWGDFAEAADDAESSGCGMLAWSCQGGSYVSLGFVVPTSASYENAVERCREWFGNEPDLRGCLSETAELRVVFVREQLRVGSVDPFDRGTFGF